MVAKKVFRPQHDRPDRRRRAWITILQWNVTRRTIALRGEALYKDADSWTFFGSSRLKLVLTFLLTSCIVIEKCCSCWYLVILILPMKITLFGQIKRLYPEIARKYFHMSANNVNLFTAIITIKPSIRKWFLYIWIPKEIESTRRFCCRYFKKTTFLTSACLSANGVASVKVT